MTAPNPFEYTDDSVVARLSVDIPNQAVTDISQLTTAMSAMRTELEAISRAQSDWLSYLQQMPVIVEQSNQALRNQITLMERMSYLQAEIGTSGGGGGGGGGISGGQGGGDGSGQGMGTGRVVGGSGGSSGGYSTAAPAGFRDDFQGMPGTGREVVGSGDEQLTQDPRALANMAASRGIPVNLGMLGALGGILSGKLGLGNDPAGSKSPQKGNADRTAGGAPAPDSRGEPGGSEDQDEPGESGRFSAAWEDFRDTIRKNIKNEHGQTATTKQIGSAILKKGAKKLMKGGKLTGLGKGGLLIGGAVVASQIQNIGEDITEYQQLGSVRGGDYLTGMGMELENRVRALDPFVNLGQTRNAMQAAYGAGFSGESVSEVQSAAISNFKELGMSMQQTARMMAAAMYGEKSDNLGKTLEERTRLDAVVRTMKELSAQGGMSSTERIAGLELAREQLKGSGVSNESIDAGELALQEAYGQMGAGKEISKVATNVYNSPNLMAIAGQRLGITGIVPSAMKKAMGDAGYDRADIVQEVAKEMAQSVAGIEPKLNRVGTFMDLMNQMGAEIPDYEAAEILYDSVANGGDPVGDAKNKLAHPKGKESKVTRIAKNIGGFISNATNNVTDYLFKDVPDRIWRQSQEMVGIDVDAQRTAELFQPKGQDASAAEPPSAEGGNGGGSGPATMGMSFGGPTQGTVTGNVTITVDKNGNVTAPPSIQLTGTQSSSQYGYGSAQMNNPPPGEGHARPPLTGGN